MQGSTDTGILNLLKSTDKIGSILKRKAQSILCGYVLIKLKISLDA